MKMVVVSNAPVPGRPEERMSYDVFYQRAYSEEGIDPDVNYMVNIHDCAEGLYGDAQEIETIGFFTLTGGCPKWCDASKVQNWEGYKTAASSPAPNPTPAATAPAPASAEVMPADQPGAPMGVPKFDLENGDIAQQVGSLVDDYSQYGSGKGARVYVFGSSKGGTGKTFTALISTYRYAKTHPHQKIALVDFDIIDGQVGISIHKVKPTIRKYLTEYQKGHRDFASMYNFHVRANPPFPQNVDFYLAPSSNERVRDDNFWLNVIKNCVENYDVVVFDTGIDYINLRPISYVYKAADKILLVTTTSIKSVSSVSRQIGRLKGETPSKDENGRNVFSKEDDIGPRLNIIITQMIAGPSAITMNRTIYNTLHEKANVVATFGVITDSVSKAEFFGEWNVFDNNTGVNKALDDIMAMT